MELATAAGTGFVNNPYLQTEREFIAAGAYFDEFGTLLGDSAAGADDWADEYPDVYWAGEEAAAAAAADNDGELRFD